MVEKERVVSLPQINILTLVCGSVQGSFLGSGAASEGAASERELGSTVNKGARHEGDS